MNSPADTHQNLLFEALRNRSDTVITDTLGRWTGRDLFIHINTWMRRLDRIRANRVAWQLPNGADWVALDLALLQSGRIAVPLPDFFTTPQAAHAIETAGVDTLITVQRSTNTHFNRCEFVDGFAVHHRERHDVPPVHAGTSKITFTSGSTGNPKGVCLSAKHLLTTAASVQSAFSDNGISRHLCVLPLSLLLENVAGIYASLLNGSQLFIPPLHQIGITGSSGLNVTEFIRAQHTWQPHSLILVPQLLQVLMGAALARQPLPTCYRMIAVGGARVAPHLLAAADVLRLPVFEGYGLSECGSVVALNRPGAAHRGSVGKPLPHAAITIDGRGEVHVAGASMLGYLGGEPAASILATGDLGHINPEGFLFLDGRIRNCFITAFGRNVNPEWIESELTAEAVIAQATVFGESLPGNISVIVPRTTDHNAIETAVQSANERLPDYARISQWIVADPQHFMNQGCLTGSGKVRRERIAEVFAAQIGEAKNRVGTTNTSFTASGSR